MSLSRYWQWITGRSISGTRYAKAARMSNTGISSAISFRKPDLQSHRVAAVVNLWCHIHCIVSLCKGESCLLINSARLPCYFANLDHRLSHMIITIMSRLNWLCLKHTPYLKPLIVTALFSTCKPFIMILKLLTKAQSSMVRAEQKDKEIMWLLMIEKWWLVNSLFRAKVVICSSKIWHMSMLFVFAAISVTSVHPN